MSVNIAGIMGGIVAVGLSYWLIESGGTHIQESITAIRTRQANSLKSRYIRDKNPGKYWLWVIRNFLWGLLLCFFAGALLYTLYVAAAASTLR